MAILECIASRSGRWLAVHRGDRLGLHAADDGALTREVARDGVTGEVRLVFTPSLLVECATGAGTTRLTGFALPDLRITGEATVPFAAAPIASAGSHLLMDAGHDTHLVRAELSMLGHIPLLSGGPVRWAVGIDDEQFLVRSARGPELWNARLRRPVGQVALGLPDQVRALGVSQQRAWFIGDDPAIAAFRLSDGKPSRHVLPAPARRAVGHPDSGWVLFDAGATWMAINLVTGACEPVPASVDRPCALVPQRSAARLAQPVDDGLDLWELGGATPAGPGLGRLQLRLAPDRR